MAILVARMAPRSECGARSHPCARAAARPAWLLEERGVSREVIAVAIRNVVVELDRGPGTRRDTQSKMQQLGIVGASSADRRDRAGFTRT